jgi:monoterpene epsilon-lactone hydrolase
MSLRAELLRLGVRWFIKRRGPYKTIEEARQRMNAAAAWVPRAPKGTVTVTVDAGGVPADRIGTRASQPDRNVLYLHGGGYVTGSPSHYRHFTWRIAAATRATVLAIDYRLAPERPFPAALDDAVAAYRWLLDNGANPRRTMFIGDSAGGGLALAALLKVRDDDMPLPAAVVALSPWTDLALTRASLSLNARADPMLNVEDTRLFAACYLAGADPRSPHASPLYGDPAGLPPTLIHVGSDEILLDDSVRMADRLRAGGRHVEFEIWPRMPHVWHLFAPVLPEARQAIARIGAFAQHWL